jgi:hypothetical protein
MPSSRVRALAGISALVFVTLRKWSGDGPARASDRARSRRTRFAEQQSTFSSNPVASHKKTHHSDNRVSRGRWLGESVTQLAASANSVPPLPRSAGVDPSGAAQRETSERRRAYFTVTRAQSHPSNPLAFTAFTATMVPGATLERTTLGLLTRVCCASGLTGGPYETR